MPHLAIPCLLLFLLLSFLCQAGYVNGNPPGSRLEIRSKKNLLGGVDFYRRRLFRRTKSCGFPVLLHSTGNTDYIRDDHPSTPRQSRQPDSLPWEPTRPQDKAYFWERMEAPPPPLRPRCNFIQDSSVPFLSAWNCPFQVMKSCQATKILSPQGQIILPRGSPSRSLGTSYG